ncbi:hypothetical protein M422DRAFT_267699 [Sphaerobolus stellatus SS14]|uniref:Uncharacterized protein n=1 Tax=Sphaerobolus stellatus (strain SS14) TaxID=990650 RepID=A0A0C9TLI6_SPHS4|nr:hypothetical protein M422DRAFT_267699 [Sphaerobolus stellatus SS14]
MDAPTAYALQLALTKQKLGHALWDPDHTDTVVPDVGSIGYVTNGKWVEIDRLHDPKVFSRIQKQTFRASEPIISTSIRRIELSSETTVGWVLLDDLMQCGTDLQERFPIQFGGSLQYTCSKDSGAILVLGDDADRVNALNIDYFKRVISVQYSTWLNKANGEENSYGINLQDLVLVTGYDKTSLWKMQPLNMDHLNFVYPSMQMLLGSYKRNWGPTRELSATAPKIRDQYIFIRGCKVLDRNWVDKLWQRNYQKSMIVDGMHVCFLSRRKHNDKDLSEESPDHRFEDDDDRGSGTSPYSNSGQSASPRTGFGSPRGSSSSPSGSTDQGTSGSQSGHQVYDIWLQSEDEDEENLDLCSDCSHAFLNEDFSTVYECVKYALLHPIDVLLLYMLKTSDAILAVVHHDDIQRLLPDNSVIKSTDDFAIILGTLKPCISVEDGAAYLSRSESSHYPVIPPGSQSSDTFESVPIKAESDLEPTIKREPDSEFRIFESRTIKTEPLLEPGNIKRETVSEFKNIKMERNISESPTIYDRGSTASTLQGELGWKKTDIPSFF